MPTQLIPAAPSPNGADTAEIGPLAEVADQAAEFIRQSKAANTIRAYRADWAHFAGWCQARGQSSLPASEETVAFYITDLADSHKPATLTRRLSAISQVHQIAGVESPTQAAKVRLVMAGIRRAKGTASTAKTPVLVSDLRRMTARLPKNLLGIRDRALLLVGFCGAFRRSELVALDRDDVEFTREGLVVNIRRSKTDQEGERRKVGIPYGSNLETCPIRSLQDWIERSGITEGPQEPARAYVQLMNGYNTDPSLLIRDLPHRDPAKLNHIAQNLTILLWSDFRGLVCGPGADPETSAVKRELERRMLG